MTLAISEARQARCPHPSGERLNRPSSALDLRHLRVDRLLVLISCLILVGGCSQRPASTGEEVANPYQTESDPFRAFDDAVFRARSEGKQILVVFGAPWCPDCRAFYRDMQTDPLAGFLAANFVVMHVDIGNWNRNMDFVERFGRPVAKGIPTFAVADAGGEKRFVATARELAAARRLTNPELTDWLAAVTRPGVTDAVAKKID